MSSKVVNLNCPGCGAPAATSTTACEFCGRPIVISNFSSVSEMSVPDISKYANAYRKALSDNPDDISINSALAMCYLKLKNYDKATASFEKAIEDNFDNSELFFFSAIALLKGKKAFFASRDVINKIEEHLNNAIMIEPRGIYYYFMAYVKFDYFSRKKFKTSPTWQDLLHLARENNVTASDMVDLYALLGVDPVAELAL